MVIFDSYGNYQAITYDSRTVEGVDYKYIAGIVDDKERRTVFHYDTNMLLTSIVTPHGERTAYTYENGSLVSITYPNGKTLDITYYGGTASGESIRTVRSSDGVYALLSLIGSGCKVCLYSEMETICHGTFAGTDTRISETTVQVVTNDNTKITEATVTDEDGNQEIWLIHSELNRPQMKLTVIDGLVSSAERYEYSQDEYETVEYADRETLNQTPYADFGFVPDKYVRTDYDAYHRPVAEKSEWIISGAGYAKPVVETHFVYDEAHRLIRSLCESTELEDRAPKSPYPVQKTTVTQYRYNDKGSVTRVERYVDGGQVSEGVTVEEHEYDDKGHEIRTVTYNTLDASSKFYTEKELDEEGGTLAEIDPTGEHKSRYEYDAAGVLCREHLPNGGNRGYGYDAAGRAVAVTQSTEEGEENSNSTVYTYDVPTQVTSGNNTVRYTYDSKRRITAVKLNNSSDYVTYAYENTTLNGRKAKKVTTRLKNITTSSVVQDLRGNTVQTTVDGKNVTFAYDAKDRLTAITGRTSGALETFSYDSLDNLTKYQYNENGSKKVSEDFLYNANGQMSGKKVTGFCLDTIYSYGYKNNSAKTLETVSFNDRVITHSTDCLGRNRGKTISIAGRIAEEQITYLKVGDHATTVPATIFYGDNKNGRYVVSDHFKYKYDSMGNIAEIRENGELYAKYTYDAIGRIVREDNKKLGKTVTFTYDNSGNILYRKEYAFTLKDSSLLDEMTASVFSYTYNGDRLLSYNGETCNPTTYRGQTAVWNSGRQLATLDSHTFEYDNLGRRTKKNSISFFYDSNGNLLDQSNGLRFFYDASGLCAIRRYDTYAFYFYRKDALGNIVALLDSTGNIVARYSYDAWGNHKVLDADGNEITDANHIANLNPFRYRGYYYDTETGLYYLKSRYYDPETGRFITIDDISYLDPNTINGLNLYAYCGNNPVMRVDSSGCFWLSIWDRICDLAGEVWNRFSIGVAKIWDGICEFGSSAGNWVVQNWDMILGVALIAGSLVACIFTFGGLSTIMGMVAGGIFGGSFGALSAAVTGGDILQGFLTGMFVGALGGFHGGAAALGAAGMTFINDRINGKKADWSSLTRATVSATTAGLFSQGCNSIANFLIKSCPEIFVKCFASIFFGFVFSSYNFLADAIIEKIRSL